MRISFVIPAFNAATMLPDAIDSIFAGNFTDGDEVIIVNDASSDETGVVAESLKKKYAPHVHVIHNQENKGCPASRNVGITSAHNELICNLDADNILAPNSIHHLQAALEQQNADMVAFGEYHFFSKDPAWITHKWLCKPGVCTLADFFAGHINPGPGGNFLYTKASWSKIGQYWEYGKGLHEAWGFTLKQLTAGSILYVVEGTHYYHRHGHASLFATESKKKEEAHELVQKMIAPYQNLITPIDWKYMQSNTNWYEQLDQRPIQINDSALGKNGIFKRTPYGIYVSIIRKLQQLFTT